jgi:hypothetical protein
MPLLLRIMVGEAQEEASRTMMIYTIRLLMPLKNLHLRANLEAMEDYSVTKTKS